MTDERKPVDFVSGAVGLCIVALGVLLLLQMNGLIQVRELVRLWPVALILIGGAIAVQASRGKPDGRCFPVGGLVWVLALGLLASYTMDRKANATSLQGEGRVNLFAVMGADRRPAVEGAFRGGQVTTVMGGANLDLRRARVAPGETVVVDVFSVMGGTELRVPADWKVDVETMTIMGGVNDQRGRPAESASPSAPEADANRQAAASPPRVRLTGTVIMAGVTVKR